MTEGILPVEGGHALWWSSADVNKGIHRDSRLPTTDVAVLIVHGGPGGRSRPESAQWFRHTSARWVMLDQRGCGQSTPHGSLTQNTTDALVADMERLREHLGIARWVVCGGSWGALLALRYARSHPSRVMGVLFRSPFLGTPREMNGFFEQMPKWLGLNGRRALNMEPRDDGAAVLQKLTALLMDEQTPPHQRQQAALLWEVFENDLAAPATASTATRNPTHHARLQAALSATQANEALINKYRMQAHYLSQACFMEPDWEHQLAQPQLRLEHLPVEVVQGDSDRVCPPWAAQCLLKLFPRSVASWVSGGGHDMRQAEMHEALTQAATRLVNRVTQIAVNGENGKQ